MGALNSALGKALGIYVYITEGREGMLSKVVQGIGVHSEKKMNLQSAVHVDIAFY